MAWVVKTENAAHKAAFELYYAMGTDRSTKRIAEELGLAKTSVDIWSKSFGWVARVVQRDAEIAAKVEKVNIQAIVDIKTKLYRAIDRTLDLYSDNLAKGVVDASTTRDLANVGALWLKLEAEQGAAVKAQPLGVNSEEEDTFEQISASLDALAEG